MVDRKRAFPVVGNFPTPNKRPIETDIVLVGGGHTHVQVLKSFGMRPEPGVRLTLIAKELNAPYSGMLPGLIAGRYRFEECHIDLVRLAQFAGARIIHGEVDQIDRSAKRVGLPDRPSIHYDLVSFDVGITPDLGGVRGAGKHGIAVKPISTFWPKWQQLEARVEADDSVQRITIIGGGAAGFELALAAAYRLRALRSQTGDKAAISVTLVAGEELLPTHNHRARSLARRALITRNVQLIEHDMAKVVSAQSVTLDSGLALPSDATLITTGARAPDWIAKTDFTTTDSGYIAIGPTLQMRGDDNVFAVGDCATSMVTPREKSGVFAVRQGPPLIENLRRRAREQPVKTFIPQTHFLTVLSLADGKAIAAKGPLAASGAWAWRLKDHIDRKFMRNFIDLPQMSADAGQGEEMRCGGCAAKVGPVTLRTALEKLGLDANVSSDDAAVIDDGGKTLKLQSIDFFKALWPDPYVLGEIAANHALNDIYAMSGTPERALALAVVPHANAKIVEEDLYQLLAGAKSVFDKEDVELSGGHSGEGHELAIGFAVTGQVGRDTVLRKSGLKPGDHLILTKPIGTGIVFASHMRGTARADEVFAALGAMRQSNRAAASILKRHGATAITDVTGFGLAGHLIEMLKASGCSACVALDRVPLLPGVLDQAQAGNTSTLLEQNLALSDDIKADTMVSAPTKALLFDPQTSGGLLAGLPTAALEHCLKDLKASGFAAADIGTVGGRGLPQIELSGRFQNGTQENREGNNAYSNQSPEPADGDRGIGGHTTSR